MAPHREGWWNRHQRAIGATIITAVVIPVALAWSGVLDIRFNQSVNNGAAENTKDEGTWLSPDSPVTVRWTGRGDTIELYWNPMDYPDLDHYDVDVYGLAPVETWYSVGYRIGDELRTSDTTNPISITNENFAERGDTQRVTSDQTWRVCVTGMRETPGGVDITPYIIERSKRCSDPFTIPVP